MNLSSAVISRISMTLKTPFHTSLGTVTEREGLVLELYDTDGKCGLGEGVAFSSPWYTEETVASSLEMIQHHLLPLLFQEPLGHPEDLQKRFSSVRGNPMAKAAVDMAVWDLYAKQKGVSLSECLGGSRTHALAGVAIGSKDIDDLLDQAEQAQEQGYQRIKVKIRPGYDLVPLKALREQFPLIQILADANSAYSGYTEDLLALDDLGLQMIEQPFAVDDLAEHAAVQLQMKTPICLDESINSYRAAVNAITFKSCRVINLKIGRVGGITAAKKIHDLCMENDIQIWCGGMLEFGISRAHNAAISMLPGFTIPGDLSASSRYWTEDITTPELIVNKGLVEPFQGNGIGVELNRRRLDEVTLERFEYPE
ncbi:o-succinylbenzoate synthase [Jeotgalibacillus haloalkalitolerans]|uniref:o-succinylbenzoate synthase n=1 Tax=Jeotgalibacillus haloalkalitolerans TaxID=3104292 RepID=A0ABU5KN38_9BACL|nr:o-succinylbenzoate synthase [Jeotgalibacillus sp. HH7-29]MDZ5712559.1 o-succinylbenzoate synthase [Jeotgalibacillus sp. HH7-29]